MRIGDERVNLSRNTLREFKPGDTLYIQRLVSGYSENLLCKFVRLDRGVVVATVISSDREYWTKAGTEIRARASKCYLWGEYPEEKTRWRNPYCHWFAGLDTPAGEKGK